MISSTSAWRAGDSGNDLDGVGCQSSVEEVWRISKCSPGAEPSFGLCCEVMVLSGRAMIGLSGFEWRGREMLRSIC